MPIPDFLEDLLPPGDGADGFRRLSVAMLRLCQQLYAGCSEELPASTAVNDFFTDGFDDEWSDTCDSLWVYLDSGDVYAAFNKSERDGELFAPAWVLIHSAAGSGEEIGVVKQFAGASAPSGYLICDGSAVSETTYSALFAVTGYTFGNPGGGDFNLPDLRHRTIIGVGSAGGFTARALGDDVGSETHTLTEAELASHTHESDYVSSAPATGTAAQSASQFGRNTSIYHTTDYGNKSAGSDSPHNNMQPSLALNHIIYSGV